MNDGVGTTNFSGIASLVGGTGADQFQVTNAGSLAVSINGGGGAGVNTLDLSTRTTGNFDLVTANSGSASGIAGGYTDIATLAGNGTTSTLTGTNTGSNYTVTGTDSGTINDGVGTTTFSGIASLAGGAGDDTFVLSGPACWSAASTAAPARNTLNLSAAASANFTLTELGHRRDREPDRRRRVQQRHERSSETTPAPPSPVRTSARPGRSPAAAPAT